MPCAPSRTRRHVGSVGARADYFPHIGKRCRCFRYCTDVPSCPTCSAGGGCLRRSRTRHASRKHNIFSLNPTECDVEAVLTRSGRDYVKPSCVSLAGVMCGRRERAFSTYQSRRTTALPSPCLDTLRTSANAHEVAPRARASPSSAQLLRGTRPSGRSQWAWLAPFGSWGTCITQP
jgi:hypothetical protein